MDIFSHIQHIDNATRKWLQAENRSLKEAIDKTVQEGLFFFRGYQICNTRFERKSRCRSNNKMGRASRARGGQHQKGKKVLCLHAGNLPLVGFQDALGTILSGANYSGKLSKKDPYLLPTWLDALKDIGLEHSMHYSTSLDPFDGLQAHKVLFAGSEQSVQPVKEQLIQSNAAHENTEFVVRTAKFSMAYIPYEEPQVMTDLVELYFVMEVRDVVRWL